MTIIFNRCNGLNPRINRWCDEYSILDKYLSRTVECLKGSSDLRFWWSFRHCKKCKFLSCIHVQILILHICTLWLIKYKSHRTWNWYPTEQALQNVSSKGLKKPDGFSQWATNDDITTTNGDFKLCFHIWSIYGIKWPVHKILISKNIILQKLSRL